MQGVSDSAKESPWNVWVSMDGIEKSRRPGLNYVFVLKGEALKDKYIIHGDPHSTGVTWR